jgi:hypothetical protein
MNIIDNFLSEEEFDKLCALTIDSRYFPWFSNGDGVAYTGDLSDKYFMHTFYDKHQPNSHNFECLTPVLDKLAPKALIRARANWYTSRCFIRRRPCYWVNRNGLQYNHTRRTRHCCNGIRFTCV